MVSSGLLLSGDFVGSQRARRTRRGELHGVGFVSLQEVRGDLLHNQPTSEARELQRDLLRLEYPALPPVGRAYSISEGREGCRGIHEG